MDGIPISQLLGKEALVQLSLEEDISHVCLGSGRTSYFLDVKQEIFVRFEDRISVLQLHRAR